MNPHPWHRDIDVGNAMLVVTTDKSSWQWDTTVVGGGTFLGAASIPSLTKSPFWYICIYFMVGSVMHSRLLTRTLGFWPALAFENTAHIVKSKKVALRSHWVSNRLLRRHWALKSAAPEPVGARNHCCWDFKTTANCAQFCLTSLSFKVTALLETYFVCVHRPRKAPYANLVHRYIYIYIYTYAWPWHAIGLALAIFWVTWAASPKYAKSII